jgi:hypothetical protein
MDANADQGVAVAAPKWIACHDTLVCMGASQLQKWCVREGDEKGPLVAVMLTKDVAHILAAGPDLLIALSELVNEIRAYTSPECDDEGSPGAAELKAADAAIAKATAIR